MRVPRCRFFRRGGDSRARPQVRAARPGRSVVLVLVTTLLAGLLGATGSLLTATPTQAAFATGGSGLYRGSIDWFEWGAPDELIPAEGLTRTNTRDVAGRTLATTCTISNVEGGLQTYRSGSFRGDGLDDLYNVGGTGGANQMVAGLANTEAGALVSFRFSCSVTLDGVPVPLQGLVFADAESSGASSNEYVEASPEQPVTWRVIDRFRSEGCEVSALAIVSADDTMRLTPNDDRDCMRHNDAWAGPTAVGFMDGATSARVSVHGGGKSAVALGVVLQTDFGDAPASYGEAGSLFEPSWQGGTVAVGTTPVSGGDFALGTPGQPTPRLGATVDAEPGYNASADATGDDTTGGADEDAIDPPGTIHVTPGSSYTLKDVRCTGPGYVAGWIDWNHNGTFDAGERSGVEECTGTSVDLAWKVPADAVDSPGADQTFLRLRIAGDEDAVAVPTGFTTSGEVEDYALNVALPRLAVEKTSTATAESRPGDTVTYTVRATNKGETDYTDDFPAVVFDDLSGVLDDATYRGDASASRPGPVSYVSPLLSWTGALPAGETVELTYTVTLKEGGDGTVRNVAWEPDDPEEPEPPACDPPEDGVDPKTGQPCAEAEFPLPRLSISKTADRTELPAEGDKVTYTITVTNEGPGDYTADAPASMTDDLSDVLDAATFDDDASATAGTVSYDEPTLSWSGPLAAKESVEITYTVTYTGEGDQNLRNRACVPEAETAAGEPSCDVVQIPGADLTQWKQVQASGTPVVAGTVLTYTLFFANDGAVAADVDAVDDLTHVSDDADVTVEPASADGLAVVREGNRISVSGSVPAGKTYAVTYQVTVKPDGERGDDIAANFLLAPDEKPPTDPVCRPEDKERPDCTVTPIGRLLTSKAVSASQTPVVAGTVLTYTLTFDNEGEGPVEVDRTDLLGDVLDDAELTGRPAASDDALSVAVDGDTMRITGGLDPGQTVTVTYRVTVKDTADRGNNTADNFLVETGTEPPAACEKDDPNCTVNPLPNISSAKSADPGSGSTVVAGQQLTYTLTFTNTGEAAGPVDHSDDLTKVLDDAQITTAPKTSDPALRATSGTDGVIRVTGTLVPDQTVTVTYTVTVRPDGERGDNRLGNFLVETGTEPPAACEKDDPDCTEHPVPLITDTKTVEPASGTPVVGGQELTYTLTFTNSGAAEGKVDKADDLTHVTDDADVITEPAASEDALSVARDADRITITGTLSPDQTVTVSYTVKVRPTGKRGDDILANFLMDPDKEPPTDPVCEPEEGERPDCTVNHVGDIAPSKTVAPRSGTTVKAGEKLTYTLSFENTGRGEASVDYTDHMSGVLDDATLTGDIKAGDGLTVTGPDGKALHITGAVQPGRTVTVTYTVTVNAYDKQGDHHLGNFLTVTGERPPAKCVAENPLCTKNPADPPDPVDPPGWAVPGIPGRLAHTGTAVLPAAALAALLALGLGGGLLLAARRRRTAK